MDRSGPKNFKFLAWFNPGWQPQAAVPWGRLTALGDGKAPMLLCEVARYVAREAVQPSPNPSDLRLPRAMEPQINVTRNLTYLNHANILRLS